MADKANQLLLEGLQRAMAEPGGLPLFGTKAQPGLFVGNAAGRNAAQLCEHEGYLRKIRSEARGKSTLDVCAISEKGLAFLLDQVNPRPILQAFVESLKNRQGEFAELLASAQASQRYLEELGETVHKALEHFRQPGVAASPNGNGVHKALAGERTSLILDRLRHWQSSSASLGDCPLPRLYRDVSAVSGWSVGEFHDALRKLHQERNIYLHPWTGPLYELPEPTLALLVGHEVAYYASLRA